MVAAISAQRRVLDKAVSCIRSRSHRAIEALKRLACLWKTRGAIEDFEPRNDRISSHLYFQRKTLAVRWKKGTE